MKRLFTLFAKNIPFITKKIALFTILYTQQRFYPFQNQLFCASNEDNLRLNILNIEQKAIKIYENGRLVTHAYCFADKYLVTVSQQLLERGKNNKTYEYYLGGQKLKGSFKVVGSFENLVFIQCVLSKKIPTINGDLKSPKSYTEIQIIKQKGFMSVKRGFFITEDSGYGIVDGEGEIGSLITSKQGIAGIVVQLGSQSFKGFSKIIQWRHLPAILEFVKGKKIHLGISAQAIQNQEGVSVVRIAPNSPFKHDLMMGDHIIKANGHSFRDPDSLYRICIESNGHVDLVVQREGKQVQLKILL